MDQSLHPALRFTALSRLPISLRASSFETLLAGSIESLRNIYKKSSQRGFAHAELHLSVFYVNLDPAGIPSADVLDTSSLGDSAVSAVTRAFLSVLALNELCHDIPALALTHLWPRCWSWIQFLNRYHHCIPSRDSGSVHSNRTAYIFLLERFYRDMETKDIVNETPGVRILVAEHWRTAVALPHHAGIGPVCNFITGAETFETIYPPAELIDELIEGAGGSVGDLAKLVADHIRLVSADPENWLPTLHSVDIFVGTFRGDAAWISAFKSARLAEALVRAVPVIAASESDYIQPDDLADMCFNTATWMTEGDLQYFSAILKAGLLDAIVACARECLHVPSAQRLLDRRLPAVTVYRSVLRHMRSVRSETVPETSPLYAHWKSFASLAEKRIGLMDWFDSNGYQPLRACDNLEVYVFLLLPRVIPCTNKYFPLFQCGVILAKTAFRRCAGCLRQYYCSESCQRADWRAGAGGHRAACKAKCLCSIECTTSMPARDRDFLRALVNRDYLAFKDKILASQAEFISADPDEPFYIAFDYSSGYMELGVQPFAVEFPGGIPVEADVGTEQLRARAERSGGRLVLHRVCISKGDAEYFWWVPLRVAPRGDGNGDGAPGDAGYVIEIH
ncbi:hypothetical protein B0H13DRAFT_2362523 [Mycena leptocephala]|nr:hypothetical protein B0H13DRAFT_2362523 [Mycena leptocephala]